MKKRFLSILAFCFMLVPTLFTLSACGGSKKASFIVNVNVKNDLVYSVNGVSSATDDFSFSVKEYEGDTYTFSIDYKDRGYDLAKVKVTERSGKSFTKRAGGENHENILYIEINPQDGESYNFTIGDPQEKVALMQILGLDDATLSTITFGTPAYSLLLNTQIYATKIENGSVVCEYVNLVKEVKDETETESYLVSNVTKAFVPAGRMQNELFVLTNFDNGSEKVVYDFNDLKDFIKVQNTSSKSNLDFESEYDLIPYFNESGYSYHCDTRLVSEGSSIFVDVESIKDIQYKKYPISTKISAVTCTNSSQSNKMTYKYSFKVEKVNGVDVGNALQIEKEYGKKMTLTVSFDEVEVEVDQMSSNDSEQVALVSQIKKALKQITNLENVKFLLNGHAFEGENLVSSFDASTQKWTLEIAEDVTAFDVTGSNTIDFYLSADENSFSAKTGVLVSNVNYSKEFIYPLSFSNDEVYSRFDSEGNKVQNIPFKHIVDNAGNKFDTYLTTYASDGTTKSISSQVVALDMYMSDFDRFTLEIELGNNNVYKKLFESGKDYDLFSTPVDGVFVGIKMFKKGKTFDDASWVYLSGDENAENFVRYKVFAFDNNGAYLQYGNFMRVEIKQGGGNEINVDAKILGVDGADAQKRTITFASQEGLNAKFFRNANGDEGQTIVMTSGETCDWTLVLGDNNDPDIVFDYYCGDKLIFTADRDSQESTGSLNGGDVYKYGSSNVLGYAVDEIYCKTGYKSYVSENTYRYSISISGFMVKMVQIVRDADEVSQDYETDPTYVLCDRVVVRTVVVSL